MDGEPRRVLVRAVFELGDGAEFSDDSGKHGVPSGRSVMGHGVCAARGSAPRGPHSGAGRRPRAG
ncbi:hypothetical protein ACFFX0_03560 [Citricoccus parietis]|uniref:Uncharacterized protein n=1 Tax=Citricoccus parietis TaxID=592307 RepID=A0ABV5FV30_9MICC